MRVFNLACDLEHLFEGWFASGDEFDRQLRSKLIACPVCESVCIEKRLHAPYVNRGGNAHAMRTVNDAHKPNLPAPAESAAHSAMALDPRMESLQHQLAQKIRALTENVGKNFADEARAMHYEEKPFRAIRGQSTPDETRDLIDEGIAVIPVPFDIELPELQ
jgi:hypothetical protein